MQFQGIQRNHLQILQEILDACKEPKARTQLISETGVTMKKLQFCLRQLMKQNMVKFHHRRKTYLTTEKGLRYLQMHKKLEKN